MPNREAQAGNRTENAGSDALGARVPWEGRDNGTADGQGLGALPEKTAEPFAQRAADTLAAADIVFE
ncbi:MAG TPA: hypothetical protein VK638_14955 [Edaphobacter sp.]|nr:hypothetical protein [Edaphobacter sp.]